MLIKDLETGSVREYGKDCHDSLAISPDGRSLSYYNLQCGEGSRYGCFRFVMEDGEVPENSQTPDAIHAECYFNIGGFPSAKQIRADAIEECTKAYFDAIEDVLQEKDLGISLNQALTIYARIMNKCNEKAEGLKEQNIK